MFLEFIIVPIVVAVFVQALKLAIDGVPHNLNFQHIVNDYGGMPSSHASFVASLATLVAIRTGINSVEFAISFALAAVVIRDAVGFRREIGKNAALTNAIGKAVFKTKKFNTLREQMGHTWTQISAGALLGIGLTFIITQLFLI